MMGEGKKLEIEVDEAALLREFDETARDYFNGLCEREGVRKFGVCGIDMSGDHELVKVCAAVHAALEC